MGTVLLLTDKGGKSVMSICLGKMNPMLRWHCFYEGVVGCQVVLGFVGTRCPASRKDLSLLADLSWACSSFLTSVPSLFFPWEVWVDRFRAGTLRKE